MRESRRTLLLARHRRTVLSRLDRQRVDDQLTLDPRPRGDHPDGAVAAPELAGASHHSQLSRGCRVRKSAFLAQVIRQLASGRPGTSRFPSTMSPTAESRTSSTPRSASLTRSCMTRASTRASCSGQPTEDEVEAVPTIMFATTRRASSASPGTSRTTFRGVKVHLRLRSYIECLRMETRKLTYCARRYQRHSVEFADDCCLSPSWDHFGSFLPRARDHLVASYGPVSRVAPGLDHLAGFNAIP